MDDPRSVSEAIYDKSLRSQGDAAGSVLCELLDLHADRTGQNTARYAGRILNGAVRAGRTGTDDSEAVKGDAAGHPAHRGRSQSAKGSSCSREGAGNGCGGS